MFSREQISGNMCCVADFKGTPRYEARVVDREDYRVENRFVLGVERTIYEYVVLIINLSHGTFAGSGLYSDSLSELFL